MGILKYLEEIIMEIWSKFLYYVHSENYNPWERQLSKYQSQVFQKTSTLNTKKGITYPWDEIKAK
jgi:hypothetical protein